MMSTTSDRQLTNALRAVEAAPTDAEAWRALARRARAVGKLQDAGTAALRAARLDPTHSGGWQLLGEIRVRLSQLDAPIACFEQAVQCDDTNVGAWILLGQTRMTAGDLTGADQALVRALHLQPTNPDALASRGQLLVRGRRYTEARTLLEPLVQHGHAGVAWAWGLLCARTDPALGVEGLRRALPRSTGFTRTRLLFMLGDLLDALGQVDPAFTAYREANESQRATFDPEAYDAEIDARISDFAEGGSATRAAHAGSPQAVWIVGLPRSGTSLIEQMLGGHSEVHPGGERTTLPRLEGVWSEAGQPTDRASFESLGHHLHRDLAQLAPQARFVTDKLPDNLLRLGLADRIAPGSTVVHMRRDPMDALWSCYRQNFGAAFAWTTRLPWLGRVHRAQQRLVDHYRGTVGITWVDVGYADLVRDPATVMSSVLAALGLELQPECLAPQDRSRHVATASAFEVQRPIHTSSLDRASAYARHLGPLRSALDGEILHPA